MSDIVIREIAPEVWTFSRPFARFYGLFPMGGRSTAIKLSDGGVWVIASTPLSEETKAAVDKLGPVSYLLAADLDHHFFLTEWKRAYPKAKMIGVEGLPEKKKAESWEFDRVYTQGSENKFGFEQDITACYFSGFSKKDVAWLHVPSQTLIVADLIFNLPANEQYSKSRSRSKVPFIGKFSPKEDFHKTFVWNEGKDKEAMRKDAKTVAEWKFQRIIICHGDVIEDDAVTVWKTVYSKYLA